MSEHVLAAISGATIAAMGQTKNGALSVLESFITGLFGAYFLSESVVTVISKYLDIVLAYGAVYFLIALYGATVYNWSKRVLRTWQITK